MPHEPGEPLGPDYSAEERQFLVEVAHANLNKTSSPDTLKHFSDVWWNLCGWEATRAGVLDGKAQGLLTLASIVGAVVTVSAAFGGDQVAGGYWRAAAIFAFILAAAAAVWALRVADHGGFNDKGVFEALAYDGAAVDWFPAFDDKDTFRLYLREISMQRWAVYRRFKNASRQKAKRVAVAQYTALAGAILLAASVVIQIVASAPANSAGGSKASPTSIKPEPHKAAGSKP